jgi:hypothetical protein
VEHYVGIDVAQLLRMGLSVREMPVLANGKVVGRRAVGSPRRTMGTRQRARPLWLHSPRAGGANDLQARAESLRRAKDAALTFHEPVALHHAHSGGASTRRGTSPTPWGTRVGAARTIVPCLN